MCSERPKTNNGNPLSTYQIDFCTLDAHRLWKEVKNSLEMEDQQKQQVPPTTLAKANQSNENDREETSRSLQPSHNYIETGEQFQKLQKQTVEQQPRKKVLRIIDNSFGPKDEIFINFIHFYD